MRILVLLAFSILLVGAYLAAEAVFVWDALLFVAIALLCVVLVSTWREPGRYRTVAWARQLLPKSAPAYLRLCGLALSLAVALVSRARPDTANHAPDFIVWVCAVLLFLLSLLRPARHRYRASTRLTAVETWCLAALLLAAFLVRGLGVGQIPANPRWRRGNAACRARSRGSAPWATRLRRDGTQCRLCHLLPTAGDEALRGHRGGRFDGTSVLTVELTFYLARAVAGIRTGWICRGPWALPYLSTQPRLQVEPGR